MWLHGVTFSLCFIILTGARRGSAGLDVFLFVPANSVLPGLLSFIHIMTSTRSTKKNSAYGFILNKTDKSLKKFKDNAIL